MKDKHFFDTLDWREREILAERAGIKNPSRAVLWRIKDAQQIVAHNGVRLVSESNDGTLHFEVTSQSDRSKSYNVRFHPRYQTTTCDCQDFIRHDAKEARAGLPCCCHTCKHGLAARLAWNLNDYRLDADNNRPGNVLTKRELRHRLDRLHGADNWKIVPARLRRGGLSETQGRVFVRKGRGWRKTLQRVERTRSGYRWCNR